MPTPKVARNLGTLTFHRYRENRRISTIRFQTLKYTQGNYVRHFWGTTPARRLSGTTTPHATTPTSSVRQHTSMAGTAPVTGHCTPYEALHPLRGATPVTRQCTPYEALHPLRGATPLTRRYTRGATPVTRRYTPYEALHPLRGATPLTRHCTRYGALHPIRRGVMPTDRVQRPPSQEQTRNLRDDRRHAQGPGSSRSRGPQHSAITSQHSTIGDPSSPVTSHQSPITSQHSTIGDPSSPVSNHQSPISGQQPLHNHQSTISRRSRWRRRGRPRR